MTGVQTCALPICYTAGGDSKWKAGIAAAGLVAAFKEGADAVAHRDTRKQAAWHAFSILVGAGIAAAANR